MADAALARLIAESMVKKQGVPQDMGPASDILNLLYSAGKNITETARNPTQAMANTVSQYWPSKDNVTNIGLMAPGMGVVGSIKPSTWEIIKKMSFEEREEVSRAYARLRAAMEKEGNLPFVRTGPTPRFEDIMPKHSYRELINDLIKAGIIGGSSAALFTPTKTNSDEGEK